jgi:uncharacterized repeat protein (TIGR01451 family)
VYGSGDIDSSPFPSYAEVDSLSGEGEMRRRSSTWVVRALAVLGLFVAGLSVGGVAAGGKAGLFVSKSHPPEAGTVGQPLTYSLGLTNESGFTVENATLTDTLPQDVEFVSASEGCGYEGLVYCDSDVLPPDASRPFTIVVRPTAAGTVTNRASAQGSSNECECVIVSNQAVDVATVVDGTPPPRRRPRRRLRPRRRRPSPQT